MVKNTIEKLLKDGINLLGKREYNNPFLDVQLILSFLLKKDRIYLHINKDQEVNEETRDKFYELVKKRNSGYPLQYMTNEQEFMGLNFFVQEGVLIPRPDTEALVEKVIHIVNENEYFKHNNINILDLGTGSGAIGLSLAHYIKNSFVTCVDISDTAIETAKKNAVSLNLKNAEIIKGDIFGELNLKDQKFHIVVSNPPYIEKEVIKNLQTEVSTYEPKLALDGGEDGLNYYRQIVLLYKQFHADKSILSVEIGHDQSEKVEEIFKSINLFARIETDKDLSGNHRVVTGFL